MKFAYVIYDTKLEHNQHMLVSNVSKGKRS